MKTWVAAYYRAGKLVKGYWRKASVKAVTAVAIVAAVAGGAAVTSQPACGCTAKVAYYVSPSGNNASAGTSVGTAYATLNKAFTSAKPGQTVEVEAGNYTAQQTLAYDATKVGAADPVTFTANGHVHIIATQPTSTYWTNIQTGHITFKGDFEFDYVWIREDSHPMVGITFRGTQIHYIAENGNVDGLNLIGNRMGPNNLWPYTGATRVTNTGPDDILLFGVGKVCEPAVCYSYSAKNVNIVGNTFDGAYHSYDLSHSDCIQYTVGQSGYIANNVFRNCFSETLILQDAIGAISNLVVENNYLSTPLIAGAPYAIHISPCSGCIIRFNSVPADGTLYFKSSGFQGETSEPGEKIYGNIAGYYDAGQCSLGKTAGWAWTYNLFIGTGSTCGTNAGITTNPKYRDSSVLNLNISPTSPAVGFYAGSEPVPSTDIFGTPRPLGTHADAGAFEAN